MPSAGLTVLWFLGIVVLIPATLLFLKRSGLATGGLPGQQALVKTIGQLNIGQGQRLVTVEVGSGDERQWLVLGVTAQSINTLHTMAPQSAPADAASGQPTAMPSFTTLLRRMVVQQGQQGQQDKGQG
jgi:flagellar protein FliO/FliZ